jgi:hypothetical protein
MLGIVLRSRQELWHKGATSEHIQKLKHLYIVDLVSVGTMRSLAIIAPEIFCTVDRKSGKEVYFELAQLTFNRCIDASTATWIS